MMMMNCQHMKKCCQIFHQGKRRISGVVSRARITGLQNCCHPSGRFKILCVAAANTDSRRTNSQSSEQRELKQKHLSELSHRNILTQISYDKRGIPLTTVEETTEDVGIFVEGSKELVANQSDLQANIPILFQLSRDQLRLAEVLETSKDSLLSKIFKSRDENDLFEIVAKSLPRMSWIHISAIVRSLWELSIPRNNQERAEKGEAILAHPGFSTLLVLVENQLQLMDTENAVSTLYALIRLGVRRDMSVIQNLVIDINKRFLDLSRNDNEDGISGPDMAESASKFSRCLAHYLKLRRSPLLGNMVEYFHKNFRDILDVRHYSQLMLSSMHLSSQQFQFDVQKQALNLIGRDTSIRDIRRIFHALDFVNFHSLNLNQELVSKCCELLTMRVMELDMKMMYSTFMLLEDNLSAELKTAMARQASILLTPKMAPPDFIKGLILASSHMTPEKKSLYESTLLDMLESHTVSAVLLPNLTTALFQMDCSNTYILNHLQKLITDSHNDLEWLDVCDMLQKLPDLGVVNDNMYRLLRSKLTSALMSVVSPWMVVAIIRAMSSLPSPYIDTAMCQRVKVMVAQLSLTQLNYVMASLQTMARKIKLNDGIQNLNYKTCVGLLGELNVYARANLHTIEDLPVFNRIVARILSEGADANLLEDIMTHYSKLESDDVNLSSAVQICQILTQSRFYHEKLLGLCAEAVCRDVEKLKVRSIWPVIQPFCLYDYQPVLHESEAGLFNRVIDRASDVVDSMSPFHVLSMMKALCWIGIFPSDIIRKTFSFDFLELLDEILQDESVRGVHKKAIRESLATINRAVALESPEEKIPWFHQRYFEAMIKHQLTLPIGQPYQTIHSILSEILGGHANVIVKSVTPYSYTVDFECILNRNSMPVKCSHVRPSLRNLTAPIEFTPPDNSQRIAIDYVGMRHYTVNTHRCLAYVKMKQRHLEMLGYNYIQIPHFEWNSMMNSSRDARSGYLKQLIFNHS